MARTTGIRAISPQKPFQFFGIQVFRHMAEVDDGYTGACGQKPALAEDVGAPIHL
jgi:hypothetical protein